MSLTYNSIPFTPRKVHVVSHAMRLFPSMNGRLMINDWSRAAALPYRSGVRLLTEYPCGRAVNSRLKQAEVSDRHRSAERDVGDREYVLEVEELRHFSRSSNSAQSAAPRSAMALT